MEGAPVKKMVVEDGCVVEDGGVLCGGIEKKEKRGR